MKQDIEEIKVCNIEELLRATRRVTEGVEAGAWFRGQRLLGSYLLTPKVYRQPKHRMNERKLTTTFRSLAPARKENCPLPDDHVSWLTLMQHHGLPTRLLDWTESVLVATYFAVNESCDRTDRCIWALKPGELNQREKEFPNVVVAQDPTVTTVARAAFELHSEGHPTVAFRPDQLSPRCLAQHSMFTIHGTSTELERLEGSPEFLAKIIVPYDVVDNLRDALSTFGIDEHTLFPDLDQLASWLARRHA